MKTLDTRNILWLLIVLSVCLLLLPQAWSAQPTQFCNKVEEMKGGKNIPQDDLILVLKQKRKIYFWKQGKFILSTRAALGFSPKGHKTQQGDGKTPEGRSKSLTVIPRAVFINHFEFLIPMPKTKRTPCSWACPREETLWCMGPLQDVPTVPRAIGLSAALHLLSPISISSMTT